MLKTRLAGIRALAICVFLCAGFMIPGRGLEVWAQILPPTFEPLPDGVIASFELRSRRQKEQAAVLLQSLRNYQRWLGIIHSTDSSARLRAISLGAISDSLRQAVRRGVEREQRIAEKIDEAARAAAEQQDYMSAAMPLIERHRRALDSMDCLWNVLIVPGAAGPYGPFGQEEFGIISAERLGDTAALAALADGIETAAREYYWLSAATDSIQAEAAELRVRQDTLFAAKSRIGRERQLDEYLALETQMASDAIRYGVEVRRDSIAAPLAMLIEEHRKAADDLEAEALRLEQTAQSYKAIVERQWLPLRERADAVKFWGEPSLFGNLTYNWRNRTLDVFIFSSYLGPVRYGASLNVSIDTTAPNASVMRSRFVQSGGDISGHVTFPLHYSRSPYHSLTFQTLTKLAVHRLFADPYRTFNLDPGLELYGTVSPLGWLSLGDIDFKKLRLIGLVRMGTGMGPEQFYRNLALPPTVFPYVQIVGGLDVFGLQMRWSGVAVAPAGMRRPITIGDFTVQVAIPR